MLNGEGLIGRHADYHAKIAQVIEAAEKEPEPAAAIRLLQQLHAAPLDPDLLGAAVAASARRGDHRGAGQPAERSSAHPGADRRGIDLLVIQGTIVSAERVAQDRHGPANR
ncbi:hypothetical protein I552_8884 [Mycobacterium xenopi 3993]|nr:hypothetical protein I552_8884 [Mycobacterium xenopi 3993]